MLRVVETRQPTEPSEPEVPMAVEEPTATETIIERVRLIGANSFQSWRASPDLMRIAAYLGLWYGILAPRKMKELR